MSEDLTTQDKLKFLVVDDIEGMLKSTVQFLREKYPEAQIETAMTAEETRLKLNNFQPNLLVLDLQIPEKNGVETKIKTGVNLLEKLLDDKNLELNIVIVSRNPSVLVQLKDKIVSYYRGGFTITDKISDKQILTEVMTALRGGSHFNHIPELRSETLKPDWLEVLQLAWYEELTDEAIATKKNIVLRTVRNYWGKIQEILKIDNEDHINLRIRTIKRAIKKGFLDAD